MTISLGGQPSKARSAPLGMKNLGATCYLNSILQALFFTPELRRLVYEEPSDGPVVRELRRLFARLQLRMSPSVQSLTRALRWSESEQQDAHEFLGLLFSKLEAETPELYQNVTRLFNIETTDFVQCGECGKISERFDSLQDLPLSVADNDSVAAAVQTFLKTEKLEGSDQYYCEQCASKQNAERGTRFKRLPENLVIFLKRFAWESTTEGMRRRKLNDRIAFPLTLDMNRHMGRFSASASKTPTEVQTETSDWTSSFFSPTLRRKDSQLSPAMNLGDFSGERRRQERYLSEGEEVFELGAVLVHSGTTEGGHYYALVKDERGNWWRMDDEDVAPVTDSAVFERLWGGESCGNAYLLVYRKLAKFPTYLQVDVPDRLRREFEEEERQKRLASQPHLKVWRLANNAVSSDYRLVEFDPGMTVEQLLEKSMHAFAIDTYGRKFRLREFKPSTKTWTNQVLQSEIRDKAMVGKLTAFGLMKQIAPNSVFDGDARLRETFLCSPGTKKFGEVSEMVLETSEVFAELPKILTGHKLVFMKEFDGEDISDRPVPVWVPANHGVPTAVLLIALARALRLETSDKLDFKLFRMPEETNLSWDSERLEISDPQPLVREGATVIYALPEHSDKLCELLEDKAKGVWVRFNKSPGFRNDKGLPVRDGRVRVSGNVDVEDLPEMCGYAGERVDMQLFLNNYDCTFQRACPHTAGQSLRGGVVSNYVNSDRTSTRECSIAFWKLD